MQTIGPTLTNDVPIITRVECRIIKKDTLDGPKYFIGEIYFEEDGVYSIEPLEFGEYEDLADLSASYAALLAAIEAPVYSIDSEIEHVDENTEPEILSDYSSVS